MSRSKKGGNHTETTKGVPDHEDEPSNCIICLERVSCRGKLSVCNHWFCFPCILEWAENTNTCPICKARFRCITKVHVSPFKSPPTKVRVGDKDQRVWNDDDDLVPDDVLYAVDWDDFDEDYEPPSNLENPWTRSLRTRGQRQGRDVRRGLMQTSRQLQLDQYDLEDSFIDDTDEAIQAYLHSTYSRDAVRIIDDDDVDVEDEEEDDDGSCTGESSDENVPQRVYTLRNGRSSRNTLNTLDSMSHLIEEQSCASPASVASTGSFIVSDDESPDELNSDWVPFGNHSKNSRTKNRKQGRKTRSRDSKKPKRSETSAGPSTRQSRQSQRSKKQGEPEQRGSNSKRKRQQTSISDDEFQGATSSRNRESNNPSVNGWISMAEKRAKAQSCALTSTSSTDSRTRKRASINRQTKNTKSKGKKPVENRRSVDYSSSSDLDEGVLRDRSNLQDRPQHRASHTRKDTGNKTTNKFNSRLKQNQQLIPSTSASTHVERHEDTPSDSSENEDNLSDAMIIQPTPCSKITRSIFTKRSHRSPIASFDHSDDVKSFSRSRAQPKQSGSPNCHSKTVSARGRTDKDTALVHKSDLQVELSPLITKKKQKRKRVMSLSSDSD